MNWGFFFFFWVNAALQARSGYGWECLSPDGYALNSKWNDAEKYICNPLSGEVPMECLSAKTLSGRSFRNFTNRITMSAPLIYPSQPRQPQTKYSAAAAPTITTTTTARENFLQFPLQGVKLNTICSCFLKTYCCSICGVDFNGALKHANADIYVMLITEKKMEGMTRDVGTQSTPPDLSSTSPSPTSTPSIIERSLQRFQAEAEVGESPNSNAKFKSEEEVCSFLLVCFIANMLMALIFWSLYDISVGLLVLGYFLMWLHSPEN